MLAFRSSPLSSSAARYRGSPSTSSNKHEERVGRALRLDRVLPRLGRLDHEVDLLRRRPGRPPPTGRLRAPSASAFAPGYHFSAHSLSAVDSVPGGTRPLDVVLLGFVDQTGLELVFHDRVGIPRRTLDLLRRELLEDVVEGRVAVPVVRRPGQRVVDRLLVPLDARRRGSGARAPCRARGRARGARCPGRTASSGLQPYTVVGSFERNSAARRGRRPTPTMPSATE